MLRTTYFPSMPLLRRRLSHSLPHATRHDPKNGAPEVPSGRVNFTRWRMNITELADGNITSCQRRLSSRLTRRAMPLLWYAIFSQNCRRSSRLYGGFIHTTPCQGCNSPLSSFVYETGAISYGFTAGEHGSRSNGPRESMIHLGVYHSSDDTFGFFCCRVSIVSMFSQIMTVVQPFSRSVSS